MRRLVTRLFAFVRTSSGAQGIEDNHGLYLKFGCAW